MELRPSAPRGGGVCLVDVYRDFYWIKPATQEVCRLAAVSRLKTAEATVAARKDHMPLDYCEFRREINEHCPLLSGPVISLQAMHCWSSIRMCKSHASSSSWVPTKTKGSWAFYKKCYDNPNPSRDNFGRWMVALSKASGCPLMEVENMLCKMQSAKIEPNQL